MGSDEQKINLIKNVLEEAVNLDVFKNNQTLKKSINGVKEQAQTSEFNLVVLGQFKRGKTTLINALIGQPLLPSAVIPLTSVATILKYGSTLKTEVWLLNGDVKTININEIADYVTEPKNPNNEKQVEKVIIYYPSEYLKNGISIIDTPGVGSVHKNNTETTYQTVKSSDAGIFVFSADPPISEAELNFLLDIKDFLGKIFFVQNKVDQVSPDEQNESLIFTQKVIEKKVEQENLRYFPVSAKLGLEGKLEGNQEKIALSNLNKLENALNQFIEEEKSIIFVKSLTRKTLSLLDEAHNILELEHKTLSMPIETLEQKIHEFNRQLDKLVSENEDRNLIFKGQQDKLINKQLIEDIEKLKEDELPKLLASFEKIVKENEDTEPTIFVKNINDFIESSIRSVFSAWRKSEEEKLLQMADDVVSRFKKETNQTINNVIEISSKIFDVRLQPLEIEAYIPESRDFRYYFDEYHLENFILIDVKPLVMRLPKFLSRKYAFKKLKEEIETQFDRHCGRSRYDFAQRVEKFFMEYREKLEDTQSSLINVLRNTIQAAYNAKAKGKKGVEDKIAGVQKDKDVIESLRAKIMGL